MRRKILKCISCIAIFGTLLCGCANTESVEERTHQHIAVETCRRMISLYEINSITYGRYMDSENEVEKSMAADAKLNANNIAETYNDYVVKNEELLESAVEEIYDKLEIIE